MIVGWLSIIASFVRLATALFHNLRRAPQYPQVAPGGLFCVAPPPQPPPPRGRQGGAGESSSARLTLPARLDNFESYERHKARRHCQRSNNIFLKKLISLYYLTSGKKRFIYEWLVQDNSSKILARRFERSRVKKLFPDNDLCQDSAARRGRRSWLVGASAQRPTAANKTRPNGSPSAYNGPANASRN